MKWHQQNLVRHNKVVYKIFKEIGNFKHFSKGKSGANFAEMCDVGLSSTSNIKMKKNSILQYA